MRQTRTDTSVAKRRIKWSSCSFLACVTGDEQTRMPYRPQAGYGLRMVGIGAGATQGSSSVASCKMSRMKSREFLVGWQRRRRLLCLQAVTVWCQAASGAESLVVCWPGISRVGGECVCLQAVTAWFRAASGAAGSAMRQTRTDTSVAKRRIKWSSCSFLACVTGDEQTRMPYRPQAGYGLRMVGIGAGATQGSSSVASCKMSRMKSREFLVGWQRRRRLLCLQAVTVWCQAASGAESLVVCWSGISGVESAYAFKL